MRTVLDTLKLTEIFIQCDDFCQQFQLHCRQAGYEKEANPRQMHESEMMTILIYYHHSGMKCFKYYYEQIIAKVLRSYWKKPYAYEAFVAQMPRVNLLRFGVATVHWRFFSSNHRGGVKIKFFLSGCLVVKARMFPLTIIPQRRPPALNIFEGS